MSLAASQKQPAIVDEPKHILQHLPQSLFDGLEPLVQHLLRIFHLSHISFLSCFIFQFQRCSRPFDHCFGILKSQHHSAPSLSSPSSFSAPPQALLLNSTQFSHFNSCRDPFPSASSIIILTPRRALLRHTHSLSQRCKLLTVPSSNQR